MPQGTGTTVKEVAGVDPEVQTYIRKVDFLARSLIQVPLKPKYLSLLFAQFLIVLNKPSRRSFFYFDLPRSYLLSWIKRKMGLSTQRT